MATFEQIQEEIASMLDVPDGELDAEQRAAMDEYLDMLANQEAAKIDGFARFVRMETERARFCREESQRLAAKARSAEARIGFLKQKYLEIMRRNNLQKVRGEAYSISIRRNESVVVPEEPKLLEDMYLLDPLYVDRRVEYRPDKRAIKEALKGGLKVEGCRLEESCSLQIR